ncbi:MAG: YigZ family protein [Muribaculaceae bacterium]|nr:YigZ family protein [Muribaculaceae bacterium]
MIEGDDIYYNIAKTGKGQLREKMSRFLAFAYKVKNSDEAREYIRSIQNEYHDARHVCWAYALGPDGGDWQLNDNGEPSGTAGKPILGQIRSAGLTDVVVCVVRYFGGIKLGTSGLIQAYRESARLALEDAGRMECYKSRTVEVSVGYVCLDGVMRIARLPGVEILSQEFDNVCRLVLNVRESRFDEITGLLSKVEGAVIESASDAPLL